jgi:hypothetical protein
MSETVRWLNELMDLNKIVAPVLTTLFIVTVLWSRIPRRALPGPRKPVALALFGGLTSLAYAMGAGSCVLGGFLQGSAICSFQGRTGPALDAVADFFEIQTIYFVLFLFAFFLAALCALALVPGNVDPWHRFLFLLTLGKHGAWRPLDLMTANPRGKWDEGDRKLLKVIGAVADPTVRGQMLATLEEGRRLKEQAERLIKGREDSLAVLERDVIRGVRLMSWLFAITFPFLSLGFSIPFIVGALTRQTFSFDGAAAMVSLEMQPGLFWMSMVFSVLLAGYFGFGAVKAIRALRSTTARPNLTVGSDARNSGARVHRER